MNRLVLAVVMVMVLAGQAAASLVAVAESAVYDYLDSNYYFSVEFNEDLRPGINPQYLVSFGMDMGFWWTTTDRVIRGGELWQTGVIPVRDYQGPKMSPTGTSGGWGYSVFDAEPLISGNVLEFVIPSSAFDDQERISYRMILYDGPLAAGQTIANRSSSRNAPVPEPSTMLMLLPALGGLVMRRWV